MAERPLPPSLLPVRFRTSNEDRTFDNTYNTEDYRKRTDNVSIEGKSSEEGYTILEGHECEYLNHFSLRYL
jgi:hypothetical protein